MDPLLQSDVTASKNLNKDITQLAKLNQTISKQYNDIGTQRDTSNFRHQMKTNIRDALTLSQKINKNLNEMMLDDMNVEKLRRDYAKQVKSLQEMVEKIQNKEQQFQPRKSSVHQRGSTTNNNNNFNNGGGDSYKNENDGAYQNQAQSQQDELFIASHLNEMEKREEQLHDMVDSLQDLREMYQDLNTLVHEQQQPLDELENNVAITLNQVQSGTENVEKASEYQKAYRKKMCYVLLILLVVAVVIVAFVFGFK